MKIFQSMEEINNIEPTAVAVGNFDGIHLRLLKKRFTTQKEKAIRAQYLHFQIIREISWRVRKM